MRWAGFMTITTLALMFVTFRVEALPLSAPIQIPATFEKAYYVHSASTCFRVWRCGLYGCGWREVCRRAPRYSRWR